MELGQRTGRRPVKVSGGEGQVLWLGVGSVAVALGRATPCGIVNCRSTCVAASWTACWARVWLFVSVAVAACQCFSVWPWQCGRGSVAVMACQCLSVWPWRLVTVEEGS